MKNKKKKSDEYGYLIRYIGAFTANWIVNWKKRVQDQAKLRIHRSKWMNGQMNRKSKTHTGSNASKQHITTALILANTHAHTYTHIHTLAVFDQKIGFKVSFSLFPFALFDRCYCYVMVLYKQIQSYLVNIYKK